MTAGIRKEGEQLMEDIFLKEYSSHDAVIKYTKETAGYGISYLLENDYADIYLESIRQYIPDHLKKNGLRILEFGCGGGMNLIHLMLLLEKSGIMVESAYGTDFSEKLIQAARNETKKYLSEEHNGKLKFSIARNETLMQDLACSLALEKGSLSSKFHLVLGVNTTRYCHRLKKELDCAKNIYDLLTKDGICIMIDMNNKFPVFRSMLRDRLTMKKDDYSIPSLDEYALPFSQVGFQILKKQNFCWIPHSAGRNMTSVLKAFTPILNALARKRAMRSLVISKK